MTRTSFLILLLFPQFVLAEWSLEQTGDGHWITSKTPEQHQLIVAHQGDESHFLLILYTSSKTPVEQLEVNLKIDRDPEVVSKLALLEQRTHALAFRIELGADDKANIIPRMIAGLKVQLSFGNTASIKHGLDFSLVGFTDAYTDMLITNEIGKLDPDWLVSQGMQKELACYYQSRLMVQVLQARIRGILSSRLLKYDGLTPSGLPSVDEKLGEIVSRAYNTPAAQLPRHPMAEKYKFFKSCMAES